jgi:hypothetical protein
MRTRQKVTAVGAVALATAAIGGGALFTSHAMAAGSKPATGTLIIVTRPAGSDQAIKCTYHDVDLPPIPPGEAEGVGIAGSVEAGARQVVEGEPSGGPTLTHGSAMIEGGRATADGSAEPPSPVPPGGRPPVVIDDTDARPGTDAECAALRRDFQPG